MRKLFTFLCAALMSVGMCATTVVTITQNDFPRDGNSFTKDGVTVSAGSIDYAFGNLTNGGSFSTTLGNFTEIEVTASDVSIFGYGWNGTSGKKTWRGNASSLSFNGSIMGMGMGVTLKFTIAEPTVAVTGVTLNQNEAQMTVGGETLTLTATVNPNNATDQSVSWSTSDANVATVENGVVTAVAAGNATITVTTTDGYFTATCAITVTAPEPQPATTVVTITDSDFPAWGDSFTKDGVTVSAEMLDGMYGNISGPGSFSTTLGNFTKIEIFAEDVSTISGEGWSGDSEHKTWTGNASSVSFTGDINGNEEGTTLKFTIEAASTPEPAGEVTVVFAANNKTVERTVTLPHDFSCSYSNRDGELDAIIKELYEISAGHCSDDNYPVASGNEAVLAGSNGFDNYITISAAFEGTATVSGVYWNSDAYDGDGDWMDYTLTISIKGDEPEPQGETITVTWNSYDLPSYGSSFTKDGVTLTCYIDDSDLYGPGTFTTDLGNFTKIVVYAYDFCYIEATGGWSGDINQKTWTGNAASVSFNGNIYGYSTDVTIVFTIEPSGGEPTAVENVQTNQVQATKFFRDGQLLIEKNGKLFNVTGALVR